MPQKARVKFKSSLQGTLVVAGNSIPSRGLAGVPPYKSWSYLMQNELANETGGRIFYTDATGEWPFSCMPTVSAETFHARGDKARRGFLPPASVCIHAVSLQKLLLPEGRLFCLSSRMHPACTKV
jgi:hypothetical protein